MLPAGTKTPSPMAQEASRWLDFCADTYRAQHDADRLSLHEHPYGKWGLATTNCQTLYDADGVYQVVGHRCCFEDEDHVDRGRVTWVTNCKELAEALSRECKSKHQDGQTTSRCGER